MCCNVVIVLLYFAFYVIYLSVHLFVYRALVRSMGEILFLCGSNKQAVIASLSAISEDGKGSDNNTKDEVG